MRPGSRTSWSRTPTRLPGEVAVQALRLAGWLSWRLIIVTKSAQTHDGFSRTVTEGTFAPPEGAWSEAGTLARSHPVSRP